MATRLCYTISYHLFAEADSGIYPHEASHDSDIIMGATASQITNLTIVHSIVYSGADQRQHQNFASLAVNGEFPAQMASNAENVSKAKRGIATLSVDKFLYMRKQTRGNKLIPCTNDEYLMLKRFHYW